MIKQQQFKIFTIEMGGHAFLDLNIIKAERMFIIGYLLFFACRPYAKEFLVSCNVFNHKPSLSILSGFCLHLVT